MVMSDERTDDATKDQEAGNQAGAGDESSSGSSDKSKKVPLTALHEERAKNKKLAERLAALEGKTEKNGGQDKTTAKIKLGVKDLMDLSPEKLEEYLNGIEERAVQTALQMVDQRTGEFQNRAATDKVLAKFAIYQDEDTRLANAAAADLADRMKQDPDKPFEDVARETALYWSKYKVAKVKADKGEKPRVESRVTLPSAGGGAGVSHLKEERVAATSFDDVSAQADKRAKQLQAERDARGE